VIRLTRHPAERSRRRTTAGCGGCCCCCCCCCLHTVGAVIGAIHGSRIVDMDFEPVRYVERQVPARAPASPPRAPAFTPEQDAPGARGVLAHFVLFWIADRELRAGRLAPPVFGAIAEELRRRVNALWESLFPRQEPGVLRWVQARVDHLASQGKLSLAARDALLTRLDPRLVAGSRMPLGYLAHLYKLHALYQELDAVAESGEIPPDALGRMRAELIANALANIQALDPRATAERTPDRPFSAAVWSEAGEVLAQIRADGRLLPAALESIGAELPSGRMVIDRGGARCPVCSEGLADWTLVSCAACETPHHRDCWSYNHGCAVYACGSVDVAGKTKAGAPKPEPVAPRIVLEREPVIEAGPRARAVSMYWIVTAVCTVIYASQDKAAGTSLILTAPFLLAGSALITTVLVLVIPRPGRAQGFWQMCRILFFVLLYGAAGFGMMGPCVALFWK
jgi:hypothetical protein